MGKKWESLYTSAFITNFSKIRKCRQYAKFSNCFVQENDFGGIKWLRVVYFTIAIPSKGVLAKPCQKLVEQLGFSNNANGREYLIKANGGKYLFLLARAKDIPSYVDAGVADIGITGLDLVKEKNANVTKLLDLPFGYCSLVYALPKNGAQVPARVATAFPSLSKEFLESRGIGAKIICLSGAVEASVASGLADAVIDLSTTGATLKANGLSAVEEILSSNAVLIANPKALEEKREKINEAVNSFENNPMVRRAWISGLSVGEKARLFNRGVSKANQGAKSTVAQVFDAFEKNPDEALVFYTNKFDGVLIEKNGFQIPREKIAQAYSIVGEKLVFALKESAKNIGEFAQKEVSQIAGGFEAKTDYGVVGKKAAALDSAGVYAPGGSAAYPSSVLMGAIAAKTAGVKKIVLCTPPNKQGEVNPAVLVAADIAGVDQVFRIGGGQAIASMAFGTSCVPKVSKIVGPGNAFVAQAKLEAVSRGLCSIDSPAGPSEALVVADEWANPGFVASELLAQAEHSPDAAAVLVCTSEKLIDAVESQLRKQLAGLERKEIIRKSLCQNGVFLIAEGINQAIEFSNQYACEHLILCVKNAGDYLDGIRNAGAVFLGEYSTIVAGDYAAGPNHVLPTGGLARSYSGLSARDFLRETNFVKLDKAGLKKLSETIITI
ncbi:histidinol dehydrogenase, partial [Candidatus Micrarchaeota archaeon]|nr:histidinol dehydrogenase [Candidatus Micrarchaeota archaeon]